LPPVKVQPHSSYTAGNPQQIEKMRIFKLGLQENFTFANTGTIFTMPNGRVVLLMILAVKPLLYFFIIFVN